MEEVECRVKELGFDIGVKGNHSVWAWWWRNLFHVSEGFWLLTHPHCQQRVLYIVTSVTVLRIIRSFVNGSSFPTEQSPTPLAGLESSPLSPRVCSVFSHVPSTLRYISAKPPAISQIVQGLLEVSFATFILTKILLLSRLKSIFIISRNLVLTGFPEWKSLPFLFSCTAVYSDLRPGTRITWSPWFIFMSAIPAPYRSLRFHGLEQEWALVNHCWMNKWMNA